MPKPNLSQSLTKLKELYGQAKTTYYNDPHGKTLMSDSDFDKLEEHIRALDPNWIGLKKAGAKIDKKTKVKLPIPIFSLNKVKPATADKWLAKVSTPNVVISDKLDGSALEIKYEAGSPVGCYTRGNGLIGGDVSFLIPHLKIPRKVGAKSFIVRAEGLFTKSAFQKYKSEFDAARNAASGILNRQGEAHRAIRDLSIVVLQVLEPNIKPSQGLKWASSVGFQVTAWRIVPVSKLNSLVLSKLLKKRLQVSRYSIDGLVLVEDKVNPQPKRDNPQWSVAFKENGEGGGTETEVIEVEWEVSHLGTLTPTIRFHPVSVEGAKLQRATAFNAKYVEDNKLGPGARVKIVRSGDVIPYITEVVKKAQKASKPDVRTFGAYSMKGVHWVLDRPAESEEFRIKRIAKFFKTIGVEFFKEQTVRKFYAAGLTNIRKIVKAQPSDFMKVPGVQERTADRIHNAIHSVLDAGIPLTTLMDASSTFPRGMGKTRFDSIAEHFDLMSLMQGDLEKARSSIETIPGFSSITTEAFVKGAPKFLKWLDVVQIKSQERKAKKIKLSNTRLVGEKISWTGYRDKQEEEIVVKSGGEVVPFGSKTTILLYSTEGKMSTKVDKAREKGIRTFTWDELVKKFKL